MLISDPFGIEEYYLKNQETKPMKQPKRHPKLKGQRLGQVVYSALLGNRILESEDHFVGHELHFIEDEDLVKLINDYLKEQ
jgi:hypothetical protein